MVLAPKNFRDEEFIEPEKIFEENGVKVTVSSKGQTLAYGMLGAKVNIDKDITQVNVSDYDAIVFVGGGGASAYFNDKQALKIAVDSMKQGKLTAAICIAPSILANAGVLKGRKATSYPSEKNNLSSKGAIYLQQNVVEDGLIVTAVGPQAAAEFGKLIVRKLLA